ncbi:TrkH family potassium uptake protein [Nitrococcus mobilis]|uniref:Trk system potassium uptake protein n=1 Tax=Nitrococcus mobilis Nb-231 TaxID=314278 RepID=A4BP77_9GAMM|nr:TrkH family potassium uptake protein [Nitrococcus mobilis]EAR22378.1 Trk-type K+ transport system, membrane component [Nitrococcus mobilis Nb-231]
MHFDVIQRILGMLMMVFSATMLPPISISLWTQDGALGSFLIAFFAILGIGAGLWLPMRTRHRDLRSRDGFFIVTLFWAVLAGCAALPLMFAEHPHMSLTDAYFESMSGLTTTGASVLAQIDLLPPSILYYRQQLNWLGGMGIIVLAVAVLPMLGIGGMQLYRAETPGPIKDAKLTPRIAETAKALWYIYLGLTLACALAYWAGGMTLFDAIAYSFSTVSTGGFAPHSASIAYYEQPVLHWLGVAFMFIGGANFALHFSAWRRRSLRLYFTDPEFLYYLLISLGSIAVVSAALYGYGANSLVDALRHGAFQVVSFSTSTGLTTANYSTWPSFLPVWLMLISIIGGCAGSTAGGVKAIRFLLMFKQGYREMLRLIHPQGQFMVKLGNRGVDEHITTAVWGFFATYMAVFALLLLALLCTGLDQLTAFSAVVACINNLGIAFGSVSGGFANISDTAKWLLSLAMLMGRLEIFTVLVLFLPAFWRR